MDVESEHFSKAALRYAISGTADVCIIPSFLPSREPLRFFLSLNNGVDEAADFTRGTFRDPVRPLAACDQHFRSRPPIPVIVI